MKEIHYIEGLLHNRAICGHGISLGHVVTIYVDNVTCESCRQILRERECRDYRDRTCGPIHFNIKVTNPRPTSEHCDLVVIKNAFDCHEKWLDVSNLIEKNGWTYFMSDENSYEIKGEIVMKKNSRIV